MIYCEAFVTRVCYYGIVNIHINIAIAIAIITITMLFLIMIVIAHIDSNSST